MAASLQQLLSLLLVACLSCTDAQNTTENPSPTDPDVETTQPSTPDEPTTPDELNTPDEPTTPDESTTPAEREILYACSSLNSNSWHSCSVEGCQLPPWQRFYCQCDPLCVTYGDCCPDFEEKCGVGTDEEGGTTVRVGVTGRENTERDVRCIQTDEFDPEYARPRSGFRLVAVCPKDWIGAAAVTKLCQETVGMRGIAAVPVEGSDRRHYRNIYCVICHGLSHTNVTYWSISYKRARRNRQRQSPIINAIIQILSGKASPNNVNPTVSFNPPRFKELEYLAASSLRPCTVLDAITCPISDPHVLELCQRHHAPIAWNGTTFRNFACALCDGTAFPSDFLKTWCPRLIGGGREITMATLLIFSDHTDIKTTFLSNESLGHTAACTHRQIYDPFLSSCLDLECPIGFVLGHSGVRCVRIRETENESTSPRSDVEVALGVTVSLDNGPDAQNTNRRNAIWEEVAHQAIKDYRSTVTACEIEDEMMTENNQVDRENELCGDVRVQWSCKMDVAILGTTPACLSGSIFKCSVNVSFDSLVHSDGQFIAQNEQLSNQCFVSRVGNHTIQPDYLVVSTPCETLSNDTEADSNFHRVFTSKVVYIQDDDFGHFVVSQNDTCTDVLVDCPLLTFSKEDYVITGALNDSIQLVAHDRVLRSGEFEIKSNGDVEVCNFLQQGAPSATPPFKMWDDAHYILTGIGSSLSLIGLVVTVATYVAFPTLRRNAAGRALMSLVAALFFAQLIMIIGLDRTDVPTLCITFAIGSHFFWLAAFFWMNILAVDIYRTFGIGTSLSNPSERSFLRYALYGWGAPALIVATVAILSFCDCVEADVYYGGANACWVGNGTANLVSFGVPVIVIICSNAVLFCLTVAGVKKTRMASKRMNITQGQSGSAAKRPNNDLILYLKLTAIMGFTWVFGFIASFSGVEFFWYLYIALNSLQGAFVCLAFVCNRRVLAMWRARLKSRRHQSDTSSSCRGQKSFKTSATDQCHVVESATQNTHM